MQDFCKGFEIRKTFWKNLGEKTRQNAENKQTFHLNGKIEIENVDNLVETSWFPNKGGLILGVLIECRTSHQNSRSFSVFQFWNAQYYQFVSLANLLIGYNQ